MNDISQFKGIDMQRAQMSISSRSRMACAMPRGSADSFKKSPAMSMMYSPASSSPEMQKRSLLRSATPKLDNQIMCCV